MICNYYITVIGHLTYVMALIAVDSELLSPKSFLYSYLPGYPATINIQFDNIRTGNKAANV